MSTTLRAQNYENEMRYIKYDIDLQVLSFPVFPTSDVGLSGYDPRRGRCQGGDEEEGGDGSPESDRHLERRPGKKMETCQNTD